MEIVCGVRSMMNDTPSTGKSTLYCNKSIIHSKQKYLFAWKTVYTRAGRALARGVHGGPGGWFVFGELNIHNFW